MTVRSTISLRRATANLIGTEVADPRYFKGGDCPKSKKCRYSDSAFAAREDGVAADLGSIARTTGPNNGSLTIDGSFSIVGEAPGNAAEDDVLNKVGSVGCQRFWTVLGPRDWGEEAPGLRVSLTS